MNNKFFVPLDAEGLFIKEQEKDFICYLHSYDEKKSLELRKNIQFSNPKYKILNMPAWSTKPYDSSSPSSHSMFERLQTLHYLTQITTKEKIIVLINYQNLLQKLLPKDFFAAHTINIHVNQTINRDSLLNSLLLIGYKRESTASNFSEFAVRGYIIDIAINFHFGIRIFLDGNKISLIKKYDLETQHSNQEITESHVIPTNEVILSTNSINFFKKRYTSLFGIDIHDKLYEKITSGTPFIGMENYLQFFHEQLSTIDEYIKNTEVLIYQYNIKNCISEYKNEILNNYQERKEKNDKIPPIDSLYTLDLDLEDCFANYNTTCVYPFSASDTKNNIFKYPQLEDSDIEYEYTILCSEEEHEDSVKSIDQINNKGLYNATLHIEKDFIYKDSFIFKTQKQKSINSSPKKAKKKKNISHYFQSNFAENDLVVHKEYGLGRFIGLKEIEVKNHKHDFVQILYSNNDKFYLPIENLNLLTKYGKIEENIQLDKLGGNSWQVKKEKTRKKLKLMAEELIKTAATRTKIISQDYKLFEEEYQNFCESFPYDLTDDQEQAINDIYQDFIQRKIIDRLVCGDVGFGKTEVALRTVAMLLMSTLKSQIAVIVPTTLLAIQHYKTFKSRFKNSGIKIGLLCRVNTSSERTQNLKMLEQGEIDVVIGTHTLLHKNIKYKNLGLLVIDEEQQFGVKQKERLKDLKKDIHVLLLSATPIPRTLQMSMFGLKQFSIIASPPINRLPIKTFVTSYDENIIKNAIFDEIERNGRVFYVVPRIKYLNKSIATIRKLVPQAKIASASGELEHKDLDSLMLDFYNGKYNVLVSTPIIESGLDIPNANTIIIDYAHMFGLGQLYQIRGRVGRSITQAYCHITFPEDAKITSKAEQRLLTMQSIDYFNAGFAIAAKDMEIRGYGNLLGQEQSGHIREIGIELYQQMLEEEIKNAKQDTDDNITWEVKINVDLPIYIPKSYIEEKSLRLDIYRKISSLKDKKELDEYKDELFDRFGVLPEPLLNLISLIELKQLALKAKIEKLDILVDKIVISFYQNLPKNPEKTMKLVHDYPSQVKLLKDHRIMILKNGPSDHQQIFKSTEKLLNMFI